MEKNYLAGFVEESKVQYDFIQRFKGVGWIIIGLMTLVFQIIPVMIYSAIMFLIAPLTGAIRLPDSMNYETIVTFIQYIVVILGAIGCFSLYIHKIERRPLYSIGLRQMKPVFRYLKGAGVALSMQLVFFFIIIGLGYADVSDVVFNQGSVRFNIIGYVLLFLVLFLFQGAVEEMMTRGWVLPILSKYYGVWPAILLTSFLFGGMHLLNDHVTVLPVVNIILYGIFASLYAIHDGGLWGVFANHSIWNWVMGSIFGFPVSGTMLQQVSLLHTELTGPVFLTGGDFGPEGGFVITGILLVAIGITYRRMQQKKIIVQEQFIS